MPPGSYRSDSLVLLSNAMVTPGTELQLRAISRSMALRYLRIYVDVLGSCYQVWDNVVV